MALYSNFTHRTSILHLPSFPLVAITAVACTVCIPIKLHDGFQLLAFLSVAVLHAGLCSPPVGVEVAHAASLPFDLFL